MSGRTTGRWRGLGLAPRLLTAMGLIVVAGAATLLAVALLVAPQVFHAHLRMALGSVDAATLRHADEAFTSALLLSLAVAVAVATATALTVAVLVSRRIAAPVSDLADAARRVAAGQYHGSVPDPRLGPEFAALAEAFTTMADRLAHTEHTRRRLLADLAHELRTPVATLQATVEGVADGVLPHNAETWTTLTEQTGRLRRLVADLSAVSHAEERALHADPHPVPLSDVATAAVAAAQARYAAKGVTLHCRTDPQTPTVFADPARLGEAVGNLLDNALRHTPPAGTVTVSTTAARELGRTQARLVVADTGDGFHPSQAAHLFERFYRTDTARTRTSGGSGIGLTITHAIIAAHHGTITAHSNGRGQGATITITLPAHHTERRPE
ncbi:MAG TPA: ATP-binding protein [Rugosimonospora sp.]|nr:ATP-binding protein [Rugosimonospora sp.]